MVAEAGFRAIFCGRAPAARACIKAEQWGSALVAQDGGGAGPQFSGEEAENATIFQELLNQYRHQNGLLWSRVQHVISIQLAVLAGTYGLDLPGLTERLLNGVSFLALLAVLLVMRRDIEVRDRFLPGINRYLEGKFTWQDGDGIIAKAKRLPRVTGDTVIHWVIGAAMLLNALVVLLGSSRIEQFLLCMF